MANSSPTSPDKGKDTSREKIDMKQLIKDRIEITVRATMDFITGKISQGVRETVYDQVQQSFLSLIDEAKATEQTEAFIRGFEAACRRFSPSGLCGEKSPEEGLSIKQYMEKWNKEFSKALTGMKEEGK